MKKTICIGLILIAIVGLLLASGCTPPKQCIKQGGNCIEQKNCCSGLECKPPCGIDQSTGEEVCATTLECLPIG